KKVPPTTSYQYYDNTRGLTKVYWPTRLVNIKTGKIENNGNFAHGVVYSKYIIGSYIWSPESLPKYPRLKGRKREVLDVGDEERDYRDDTWEYCTQDFNAVVDLVQKAAGRVTETPKFWIIDVDECSGIDYERMYPHPDLNMIEEGRKQYLKEVYCLLVAEARLMSIEYVWIDSLCIDRAIQLDKTTEIPKMADYYSNATRCVVVSEMLRRGYSHRLERLGHNFLNPALDDDFPLQNLTEEHRSHCGLENEVLGWLAGFHQLRLWVFQETYLAKSTVHRGRNIRLNTQDLLRYGIGLPESRLFEQVQSCHRQAYRKLLPTNGIGSEFLTPITPNHCMSLVKKQARTTLKEQDFISGDAMALFLDEAQADSLQHSINGAPTWLPRVYSQMAYQETPDDASMHRRWPSSQKPYIGGDGTFTAVSPYYRITGVRIATEVDVLKSMAQECEQTDGYGKIYGSGFVKTASKTEIEIKEGDNILEIQVLPLRTVNIYFEDRRTARERAGLDVLRKAADAGSPVIACVEARSPLDHSG
ncbi:MAG: hypothetical protein Q9214_004581, partial [Letrouitia sp. 1 TL-2023]